MLFGGAQAAAIARGEITMTVRVWRRPQAAMGGRYRLRGGAGIEVTAVEELRLSAVTNEDAARSGFRSRAALVAALARDETDPLVYRVAFRYLPDLPDERARLAADDALDGAAFDALRRRLGKADTRAETPWTAPTLRAIEARPGTRAADLAATFSMETLPFKARVRRLKALGLTHSLETGYELSPRGRAYVARLDQVD